jgi:hypothetical protein
MAGRALAVEKLVNIAPLLAALRSNHHSGFGIDKEPAAGRVLGSLPVEVKMRFNQQELVQYF